jgi:NAD(P)-dependent dehydrogenase (short-subunit alcohol dehydrogenase family)
VVFVNGCAGCAGSLDPARADIKQAMASGRLKPAPGASIMPPVKTILITGASRGIGAATAMLAGQRGHAVCINYRANAAEARKLVDAIKAQGGQAIAVQADVAVEADVLRLFEACEAAFGRPRALVNNAGILAPQARLEHTTLERWQRTFATNVFGTFLCSREAVRRMSTRHGGDGGAIVNLSSVAARLGAPGEYVDYAASKGAIDSMTAGLAREVAAEGIRVNAVRPGLIYTDMHGSGGEPGRVDRLKDSVPMQRGGAAKEVAEAILWLASDAASYVTGATIDVTGGR